MIKPADINDTLATSPVVHREPEEEAVVSTLHDEPVNVSAVKDEEPRILDPAPHEEPEIVPIPEDEPTVTVVKEEEAAKTIDTAPPEQVVEEKSAAQEVPVKVVEKPIDTTQTGNTLKAQPINPSQEASFVSRECRKLSRTLSDRYKVPYDEFFSGKPVDAWESGIIQMVGHPQHHVLCLQRRILQMMLENAKVLWLSFVTA